MWPILKSVIPNCYAVSKYIVIKKKVLVEHVYRTTLPYYKDTHFGDRRTFKK